MFVKTVTVFCSYIDKGETKYARRIIKGVFIDKSKVVNTNTTGMTDVDRIFIGIPESRVPTYKTPKEFAKDVENSLTFKEGDKIAEGEIQTDYTSMINLEKEHDNIYTITGVDFKDFGSMPHFEISGK